MNAAMTTAAKIASTIKPPLPEALGAEGFSFLAKLCCVANLSLAELGFDEADLAAGGVLGTGIDLTVVLAISSAGPITPNVKARLHNLLAIEKGATSGTQIFYKKCTINNLQLGMSTR
jgi:hypothetical protein